MKVTRFCFDVHYCTVFVSSAMHSFYFVQRLVKGTSMDYAIFPQVTNTSHYITYIKKRCHGGKAYYC